MNDSRGFDILPPPFPLFFRAAKTRRVEQDNEISLAQSALGDGWLFPFVVALQISLQQRPDRAAARHLRSTVFTHISVRTFW